MNKTNLAKKWMLLHINTILMILSIIVPMNSKAQETYNNVVVNKIDLSEIKKSKLPTFEFNTYSLEDKLKNISIETIDNHYFGETIAKKIYLLNDIYTSEAELVPGNPTTRTVIKKPEIYDAVKRIEKYLKRSVDKELISKDIAVSKLNKTLDVALNIITADTKSFEKTLEELKDTESRVDLFVNHVQLKY